jgi:chemotaxis family two-component system response regulator Rcp1
VSHVPHYYFDLTDGVTKRDRSGLDCADDAAAIAKAATIADEIAAADGVSSHPDLHISIMREDGHEVSRVPVPMIQAAPACRQYDQLSASQIRPLAKENRSHIEILLVEDRPGDSRLTKEAFHHRGKPLTLHHAWDGVEAMEFLKRKGSFEDAPRPDLILLDLDIPRMNGRLVLARIKGDPNLKTIPTIILTVSDSAADILLCYKLNANCYLQKPVNWDEFDYLVTSIDRFWLNGAKFPRPKSATT